MKFTLIVPSGGVGERTGADIPKQYININGKTILNWTLSKFSQYSEITQLLIPSDDEYTDNLKESIPDYFQDKYQLTPHGDTRFHSIYNSINYISEDTDYVIVHDAARPFVDDELITRAMKRVQKYKAVVPFLKPTDTIKVIDLDKHETFVGETLDREFLAEVQTPQMFERKLFVDSYQYAKANQFKGTDDSSILEYSKFAPRLIIGNPRNTKITTEIDLELANYLLKT